jgi:3-(3-hydroxy-phenyl)propionate hydroxylase
VAAYYLARQGIDVVVVEAARNCAPDLRASTFHPPTLEMLDTLEITSELIDRGLKAPVYHWRERQSGEYFAFDLSELSDLTPYPYRVQCEQYHLARLLSERLEAHPKADMLFNHRVIGLSQDADGATVTVETLTDIQQIRADYVIGADGGNSSVRKLLGIDLEGFTYPEKFLCLTTTEPLDAHLPDLSLVNYVSDEEEWLVLLRVPSMWRVLVPADPSADDEWLVSDEKKEALFGRLIGKPDVETKHRTIYRVHQRVARSFREGRAAIIGDAAHLNNPLGGFGMNSGIHDAFNLCEKLVEIIKNGVPAEPLLDSFAEERRRITREFVQSQTIQNMEYLKMGGQEHEVRKEAMRKLVADPVARRRYLMRQAMIEDRHVIAEIAA